MPIGPENRPAVSENLAIIPKMDNKFESSELYPNDVKKLPEKISAVLLTTSRCMLNCFHCYNYPVESDLSLKNHLQILQNLYDIGVYRIVFTGGECLMLPHLIDLLKDSEEHGVLNTVSTNSILLTPEKLEEIHPYTKMMDISLNSLNQDTNRKMIGSYFDGYEQLILNRIDMVLESGIPLNVNVLISKINLLDIPKVLELLRNKKINSVKLFEHSAIRGRAKENHEKLHTGTEEFHRIYEQFEQEFSDICFQKRPTKRLAESYLRIAHNGNFEMYRGAGKNQVVGNSLIKPITREDLETML